MNSLAISEKKIPDEFFDEVVQKSTHMADLWQLSASSSRDNLGVNMMDKACGDIVKHGKKYGLVTHDQIFLAGEPDDTQLFCLADLSGTDIANVLDWENETNVPSEKKEDPNVFRQPSAVFSISYKKEHVLYKIFFCYVNDFTEQTETDKDFTARNLWQQVDAMRQLTSEKMPVVTIRANFFQMKQTSGASDTDKISHFLMDMYVQHLWTLFMALRMIRDGQGVLHTEHKNIYDVHVFLGQYTLTCDDHLPKANPDGHNQKTKLSTMQNLPFYNQNFSNLEHYQYATHYGIVNVLKVQRMDVAALIRLFSNESSKPENFAKANTGVFYLTDFLKLLKALHPKFLLRIFELSVALNEQSELKTTDYNDLQSNEPLDWNKIMLSHNYQTLEEEQGKLITCIKLFVTLLDLQMKYFKLKLELSDHNVEPIGRLIEKINYELRNKKLTFTGRQNLNAPVYPRHTKNMSLKTRLCMANHAKVELDSDFESLVTNFNIPFAVHFFQSIACTNQLACQELAQQMETNKKVEEKVYKQLHPYPLAAQTEILYFLKQVLKRNEIIIKPPKYEIKAINEFSMFFEAVFWRSTLNPNQVLYKKIRAFERSFLMKCFRDLYASNTYATISKPWLDACYNDTTLTESAYFLWKCMFVSLATNLSSDDYMMYHLDDNNGNEGRACIENAVVRQTQYRDRTFADNTVPQDLAIQIEFTHDACQDACVSQALSNLLEAIDNNGNFELFESVQMICFRGFFQINFESIENVYELLNIVNYSENVVSLQDALTFAIFKEWIHKKIMCKQEYEIEINRIIRKTYDPKHPNDGKYESLFGNEDIVRVLTRECAQLVNDNVLTADIEQALQIFVDCCIVKILCNRSGFFLDFVNLIDFENFGDFDATDNDSISNQIKKQLPLQEALKIDDIKNVYVNAFKFANTALTDLKQNDDEMTTLKEGKLVFKIQKGFEKQIFVAVKDSPLVEAWPAGDLISYDKDEKSIFEIFKYTNSKRQINTNPDVVKNENGSITTDWFEECLLLKLFSKVKNNHPLEKSIFKKIDSVRFEQALIKELDILDADMMHKHLEYMSSLTHTNFVDNCDDIIKRAHEISNDIFTQLQSGVRMQVKTEESTISVRESFQHYEQMLWLHIRQSRRDKYEKMAECYFSLAGCLDFNFFAMPYFVDVAKLFCECFFEYTSKDCKEKKQALARVKHAKVKFDSRIMLLPLLRIYVYKNSDANKFKKIRDKVKRRLVVALKWKLLLVKSTLICTLSNVLWNTLETPVMVNEGTMKRMAIDKHSNAMKDRIKERELLILQTKPYYPDWTSFEKPYAMDLFGNAVSEFVEIPVKRENVHIQNIDNLFKEKVSDR